MADKKRETNQHQSSGFGGRRLGMPVDKPKDFKGSLVKLLKYLGAERKVIFFTSIVAITSTIMGVLGPRVLAGATDEIFDGIIRMTAGIGGINFILIRNIMFIMIGLHGMNMLLNFIQGYIMIGVSMRITYKLRFEISEKIHKLPLKYFDKNTHGDVLSRITNDVDTLSNTLSQGLSQFLMSVTAVLGIVIMMLTISPLLTLAAMMILPLSGITIGFVVKRSQKYFKIQQETLGKLNGHIEEMFTNHVIVKSFGGEAASVEAFDTHNKELYRSGWRANFLSGLMMPIIGFIANIGYVVIVVIGGVLVVYGNISIGSIQAFIQYTRQFGQPVSQLAGVASVFQSTAAASERVFKFLEEEEEPPEYQTPVKLNKLIGKVEFDRVHFGYNQDVPVIKKFTAKINPGEKIAIVGHTGAGKTTIVKLLMRFYDVDSGSIFVDDVDSRHFTRQDLRSFFGMVLQDTWLFNGTIADNIRYGNLMATNEEVKDAAKAAQAHQFIRALPGAYDMIINEEADNISAGQKQLLTIARTILANPDILILDEATSNVDTRTEVLIQRAMDNLCQGRTSFVIAHRLSTIRSADLILVMENGDIVEQGSHNTLLAKQGVYAKLYNSQFDVN